MVGAMRTIQAIIDLVQAIRKRPWLSRSLQAIAVAATLAFCTYAIASEWGKASTRVENANLVDLSLGLAAIAAYYLVFILGWIRILDAWGIRIGYRVALQAEMVSMLAKYVPGGVWTPAARTVALRRTAGVTETATVLASILLEAVLSAISGVIVLVVSLAWVRGVNAPLAPLIIFGMLCSFLLHPKVFRWLAGRLLKPFGAGAIEPLPFPTMLLLLFFYCGTWVIGGAGLYFLLRAVGSDPGLATIPFLGGISAVGAIVSVLAVFVPSGLGAREATMYGMLLALTTSGPALGAVVLNRLAITLVEILLFGAGVASWRAGRTQKKTAGSVALSSTSPTDPRR
jgi:glycosyltransferase 2 family protein